MMALKITMGQAFRVPLTAALIKLGGTVHAEEYGAGSTTWTAVVTFPPEPDLQHKVTQALWARFPGAQLTVEPAGVR